VIEEDYKIQKLQKYYSNALGIQKYHSDQYLLIYPSHNKNSVNVDMIELGKKSA
jgi:hypothetical protein